MVVRCHFEGYAYTVCAGLLGPTHYIFRLEYDLSFRHALNSTQLWRSTPSEV